LTETQLADTAAALAAVNAEREGLLADLEAQRAALAGCESLLVAARNAHAEAERSAASQREAADKVS
jgi:hypothetical protein